MELDTLKHTNLNRAILLNNVSEAYTIDFLINNKIKHEEIVAVNQVSLSINKGECVVILGANGAGKTTAMKMLIGISNPSYGNAQIAGFDVYKQTEQIKPRDLLSPEEEALRNLHALFDSSILRQGKFREYFFSLSEIMRIYFEKRFLIFAAESTTAELTGLLKQKGIARELIEQIRELLEAADLAKFAKWKPEPAEVLRLNQQAEDIVRKASAKT